MKFLLYDVMQATSTNYSDSIKSSELADTFTPDSYGAFSLPEGTINCIGIAARDAYAVFIYDSNFDAPKRTINFGTRLPKGLYPFEPLNIPKDGIIFIGVFTPKFKEEVDPDGRIKKEVDKLEFATIQRLALGQYVEAGISPRRSYQVKNTSKPKQTLSGQVIYDYNGYSYTTLDVELKYKVDDFFLSQLEKQYAIVNQDPSLFKYGDNDPIFCDFLGDGLPFSKFYGTMQDKFMLQSAVKDKLYSMRMKMIEAF